jgi:hypothetical protein
VADREPLHPVSRVHLAAMSDATGILQHAIGSRPDPAHGYCTDDVARALRVDLVHQRETGWAVVAASARRNLVFLADAFVPVTGRFRNFRAVDGSWLDDGGSEDCQGRAVQALGETILLAPDASMVATARLLLGRALPAARELTALRARSSSLLGCVAAVRGGTAGEAPSTLRLLAGRLDAAFRGCPDADWPWPEPILTYENSLPAQALIAAGDLLGRTEMLEAGVRVLDWLVAVQAAPAGHLSPVGNGWWPRDGARSRFDQQPIEAAALLLAARAAFEATGQPHHRRAVEQAYGWFLGANDGAVPVAEPGRGACFDALTPTGVNANQGAESTLVWLLALEGARAVRAAPAPPIPVAVA